MNIKVQSTCRAFSFLLIQKPMTFSLPSRSLLLKGSFLNHTTETAVKDRIQLQKEEAKIVVLCLCRP